MVLEDTQSKCHSFMCARVPSFPCCCQNWQFRSSQQTIIFNSYVPYNSSQ